MDTAALLSHLRERDVRVWVQDGRLKCDAPAGALTSELRDQLVARKEELLAVLAEAALSLTRSINAATGLAVPLEPLEKASASNLEDIAAEMQTSQEVQELVATLEQQYDALHAEHQGVPSADDIAAEFEKFLADREKKDED